MLKKPLAFKRFPHDPIEQESVNLWADGFHKIARKTIPRLSVHVEHPEPLSEYATFVKLSHGAYGCGSARLLEHLFRPEGSNKIYGR